MAETSEGVWDRIAPLDVDRCAREFASAAPFPFVVIDGFLRPEFATEVCRAYPSYASAREKKEREFEAVNEYGKIQIVDAETFPAPVQRLSEALASPELLATLTEITGIPELQADPELHGAGMHLMESGSRLDLHVDFNSLHQRLYRRLNIILYLNEDWHEDWGGALDIWDADVTRCVQVVPPVANRAILFQTVPRSYHGVLPVTCPPERSRNTFAAFYYTEAVPPDWEGKHEGTIWAYRPDEKLRKYLKAWPERIARSIPDALRRLRRAARRRGDG